ncbi:MAG: adenosylcobinamide-GDP ribazoletransferase [Thermoprotei archaeon]|nr:MAG: adenosylcobinamide-GDP ribazoletransferase [Thermoprotei archaeon]
MRRFLALLSLLTRLPVGARSVEDAAEAFFLVPLVGLLEGVLTAFAISLLLTFLDALTASILYSLLHVAVTGGIHMDGLADYSDVIASQLRGSEALRVLKDPRKGSFASIAIITVVLITVASVNRIVSMAESAKLLAPIIVSCYAASAESMYIAAVVGRVPNYRGLGALFVAKAKDCKGLFINVLIYVAIAIGTTLVSGNPMVGILPTLLGVVTGLVVARDADKRLGFVNGDVMGFAFEVSRAVTLFAASVVV